MSQNFLSLSPLCEKSDIEQMSRNWKFWLRSFNSMPELIILQMMAEKLLLYWTEQDDMHRHYFKP